MREETDGDVLVVKEGALFACTGRGGDISPGGADGLYHSDTRHLSELTVALDARPLVLSSSSDEDAFHAVIESDGAVSVRRELAVADERLYVRLALSAAPGTQSPALALEAAFAADFSHMLEVRGAAPLSARLAAEVTLSSDGARFDCTGIDGRRRATDVHLVPHPATVEHAEGRVVARWTFDLGSGAPEEVLIIVTPGARRPAPPEFGMALAAVRASHRDWAEACTQITSDNETFDALVSASLRDLRALLTPIEDGTGVSGQIVAAGIPWYVTPFGRDSLLASHASLAVQPKLARATLLLLAALQAADDDPWCDAEPGKILHEIRSGDLAGAGKIPHTPYYGSVDSTPLFVILAAEYHRWTADRETLEALRPALSAALCWIDRHGDLDGDGFVEYDRRSPGGLPNQGWKDSDDAIVHADGRPAEGPIALVEVQAYVHMAKMCAAELYDELGEPDRARSLRAEGEALRDALAAAFWDADEGTLALALDGRKRQVRSVASNAGHCLFCGVLDERRAASVVERLMAPDMFSGWGVRTLSSAHPAYDPMSYHRGSVWPHDNALIAAGFKRHGFAAETEAIATALFDVARSAADSRLPELYCGFDRQGVAPVAYPVACAPQAWAATVPFLLLQAMLGISADAPSAALAVHRPALPPWLGEVELRGLRVGGSAIGLRFRREGALTSFSVVGGAENVRVAMSD